VASKQRCSGVLDSELNTVLKEGGIESSVFTGCTTDVRVESTLRDANFRDWRCLLLTDSCAESRPHVIEAEQFARAASPLPLDR
jgi:ureidoacrylate peracid hydrolase